MPKYKVLVAGASGLVGFAAVRHFAGLADWDVVGVSRRIPDGLDGADLVSVDLQDRARCAEVFGRMHDVTHLVYAALYEKPGVVQGWRERDQMETNLRMLDHLFEPLAAAARGLQHVSLLQGTKAYGAHIEPFPVPARERWPRHPHENFYWLQEDYLRDRQHGKDWRWTIFRPQLVFGEALKGNLNVLPAICVYAALRKEAGQPLSFPGGPAPVFEAVDADLQARALAWAATSPDAAHQTFNLTNGDVFVWQHVWPVIADALGMEVGPPEPCCLTREMPARDAEWAAIVDKYGLRSPRRMLDFVGGSFELTDLTFAYGAESAPPPILVSTVKIRQAGFHDCLDTEDMFRNLIARYQALGWIPPV